MRYSSSSTSLIPTRTETTSYSAQSNDVNSEYAAAFPTLFGDSENVMKMFNKVVKKLIISGVYDEVSLLEFLLNDDDDKVSLTQSEWKFVSQRLFPLSGLELSPLYPFYTSLLSFSSDVILDTVNQLTKNIDSGVHPPTRMPPPNLGDVESQVDELQEGTVDSHIFYHLFDFDNFFF